MKKLILLTALLITVFFSYAQFGGGIGTAIDPYRIYTREHLEELSDSLNLLNTFTGKHFRLMNNIEDSLTMRLGADENSLFNGSFHGSGYTITVNIDYEEYCALFYNISENGYLDSVTLVGNLSYPNGFCVNNYGGTIYCCTNSTTNKTSPDSVGLYAGYSGICFENYGNLISCINNSDLYGYYTIAGICFWVPAQTNLSFGRIENCINNGNIITKYGFAAGIAFDVSNALISNCINTGDVSQTLITTEDCGIIGGICGSFGNNNEQLSTISKIVNCQNSGYVFCKSAPACGGIVAQLQEGGIVENCSNYGNVLGEDNIGSIYGRNIGNNRIVKNCFNSGNVSGATYTGGIGAVLFSTPNDTMMNCLNIASINKPAIAGNDDGLEVNPLIIINNYYDKQMCLSKGIGDADVIGSAEGKLTTQLTGTSPELQAMLGDGWSYAEGRYPIPLGLENDSMALVAATPVYLHFENEEEYNHVDSVSKNFTVGLENNVSWEQANGRVSFSDESVTLLSLGIENLTVSLGDYSKNVRINIVDIETSATQLTIENVISGYPNPASDYININLNGVSADKMEICDITGKVISSQIISTEHSQTHIKNLKPGLYLLKIYNKYQNVTTLRFVKN
jgi:hypothetical protein